MSWLESHQSLRDHPKKDRLAELLFNGSVPIDVADLAAIGLMHCLWWWALDYAQDGDLSKFSDRQIAKGCGFTGDATLLVHSLIDAGFIDKKPRRIHDWDAYAGRLLERREQSRTRSRKWRERIPNAKRTDAVLPTDLHTYKENARGRVSPVDNSTVQDSRPRYCDCGAEMKVNGDGTQDVHCPICKPAKVTP